MGSRTAFRAGIMGLWLFFVTYFLGLGMVQGRFQDSGAQI